MSRTVLLLFDVDATLIRTHGAGMRAMSRAFLEEMGWDDIFSTITPAGMMDPAIAEALSQHHRKVSITAEEKDRVFKKYLLYLEDDCQASADVEALPGIRSFLESAMQHSDILLGLGTGNLEEGAKIKLRHVGIDHFFNFGGYGTDGHVRADLLATAVKRAEARLGTSLASDQVVVIGDTEHDVLAGKAIGAHTIAVATGPYSEQELAKYQPDLTLPDFSDHAPVWTMIAGIRQNGRNG